MEDINRLRSLGEKFQGRIPEPYLKFALDYIDYNEVPLALDSLCACICDHDVKLTQDEYDEILFLNANMGMELGKKTLSYMKNLISH